MVTLRGPCPAVVSLLVVAALAAGCAPMGRGTAGAPGAWPNATPDEVSAAATLSALSSRPQAGSPAADFTLQGIDGSDITLSALRGRAVVIAFWATWCDYCREELPRLAALYEGEGAEGLEVLAVNLEEEPQRVAAYAAELGLPYAVLMDRRGEVAHRYRVRGLPSTIFVDARGNVQRIHLGALDASTLRHYVDALLAVES